MNIGDRLKELRAESQLRQSDVADAIGVKRCTYQAYEEGRAQPGLSILIQLEAFYGFNSIDELIGISATKAKWDKLQTAYLKAKIKDRKIVDFVLGI